MRSSAVVKRKKINEEDRKRRGQGFRVGGTMRTWFHRGRKRRVSYISLD